eukprot:822951-Rhodomonas_salina.1
MTLGRVVPMLCTDAAYGARPRGTNATAGRTTYATACSVPYPYTVLPTDPEPCPVLTKCTDDVRVLCHHIPY